MNLPFFIARKYLLSKRKKNFINVISILSLIGVAFITAALVIVLSVFNGLGDLLHTLNNSFDPEIKIEAASGKTFETSPELLSKISAVKGVSFVTEVIEDYAYVRYRDANQVIILKGVSDNFISQGRIPKENIVEGELMLKKGDVNYALVGRGIQYTLSIAPGDNMFPLQVYYIKNTKGGSLDASKMYAHQNIIPAGVFSIVQQFDDNYVVVPLSFARDLVNYGNKRTSLEVKVNEGADIFSIEDTLQEILGSKFNVLNHEEQHQDIYRILKMEKLFTFLSFILLLGIGSINIFFSLMMLALDKKKDITILAALGADEKLIRRIFLMEGALIALLGTTLGLLLGAAFCMLQSQYGVISMGMETSILQGYPIKMEWNDFFYTLIAVCLITFIISIRPAVLASQTASVHEL